MIDLRQAAIYLGGEVQGNKILAPGPGHSHRDRSLVVTPVNDERLKFLAYSFAGDDWAECRDYVKAKLGLGEMIQRRKETVGLAKGSPGNQHTGPVPRGNQSTPPTLAEAGIDKKLSSRAYDAIKIWKTGISITGTLAETYLKSRGIVINPGANVLRFIDNCPFGRDRLPCMVALFRDIQTDEITGIHRTALTKDGQKIDRKMLGRSKNAAIKLTPDENVTSGLGIAEGIETALTVIQAGWSPVWAMGAATGIANFPVMPGIEALTIFADNDPVGLRAANQCVKRWRFKEVYIQYPGRIKTDFNDYVGGN